MTSREDHSTRKKCDVVMKGGITSGVVYPRLITALSKVYTLRNIGGTSAGAIAAAAAAAAQLGDYAKTNPNAFEQFEKLPKELGDPSKRGEGSMLLNFFQPQKPLRKHFAFLVGLLNAKSASHMVSKVCTQLLLRFPLGAIIGVLPGIVLFAQSSGIAGRIISLVLIVLGALVGGLAWGLYSFVRELPKNSFGLCNGTSIDDTALTPWLSQYLNTLAGKGMSEPVTFGELWAGVLRESGKDSLPVGPDGEVIQLMMMTTALNVGRPYRLPFEHNDLYFDSAELRKFFPEWIHRWLVAKARPSGTAEKLSRKSGRTFLALPLAKDLPIVFAARLSLSFPILLSAVPLYAVDRTLKVNKVEPTTATRIYFSDGGICSNFPVHFFDRPLPLSPTFGVNLRNFHPEHIEQRVWLPKPLKNNQGLNNHFPPLPDKPGLASVVGFIASMVTTMLSWRDEIQLAMPGFRDRIVHVSHTSKEGGLNLNMDPDVIDTLSQSGADAAEVLINAFAKGGGLESPNAWDNHQRIRVRTALSVLQQMVDAINTSLSKQQNPSYEDVVGNPNPPSYEFQEKGDAGAAVNLLHALQEVSKTLKSAATDLSNNAPKPTPELRIVPRI